MSCIVCNKKLDFVIDEKSICGSVKCMYQSEEMVDDNGLPIIRPNIITQEAKRDITALDFLITNAVHCANGDRFMPFPPKWAEFKCIEDLRELDLYSTATVKKDYGKLRQVANSIRGVRGWRDYDSDDKLKLTPDQLYFVRFVLLTNNTRLEKVDMFDETVKNCPLMKEDLILFRVTHPPARENEFNNKYTNHFYTFHGSPITNWYSILRNGLKNCSQTSYMTTGAVYGNGIYTSRDLSISISYAGHSSGSIFAVVDVAGKPVSGNEPTFGSKNEAGCIVVIPDESRVLIRYFYWMKSALPSELYTSFIRVLNSHLVSLTDVYNKKEKIIQKKHEARVLQEIKEISKTVFAPGDEIVIITDDITRWKAFINMKFDPITDDQKLLMDDINWYAAMTNSSSIEVEVLIPRNYPFAPPRVFIKSPRFTECSGHIVQGALCVDMINASNWNVSYRIISILVVIKNLIIEGKGRIDRINYNLPYKVEEADDAFKRLALAHNW